MQTEQKSLDAISWGGSTQDSGYEESAPNHGRVDEKEASCEDEIREATIARNPEAEGMGVRKHEKGLLENLQ